MQQIILESSPWFILVCIFVALLYAYTLYSSKHPWSKLINKILFVGRFAITFILCLLLLGPIVRHITNYYEKPVFVFIQDNSASIAETTDSTTRRSIYDNIVSLEKQLNENGFETHFQNLEGNEASLNFNHGTSDLAGALKKVSANFEGRNIAGVALLSDGIYNSGIAPQFSTFNFPIHTIGLGDTVQRPDIAIKDVLYNKIAYQGNKFPLNAEVIVQGFPNTSLTVSLFHNGKLIENKTKATGNNSLLIVEFLPTANEPGIQRYDIKTEVKTGERNVRNNTRTVFIDVIEGKKKILLLASAPHPDSKALNAVLSENANYEVTLHIAGVDLSATQSINPTAFDFVILHQAPDQRGRTSAIVDKILASDIPAFFILGSQSDLRILDQKKIVSFDQLPQQYDEVTPVVNTAFQSFTLSAEALTQIDAYPPVSVHFGKQQIPTSAVSLLTQQVGSLMTEKPLLYIVQQDNKKMAVMLGNGLWRWRLHEYSRTEKTVGFDELFGKLFQYLTTDDEKRRFRSYPIEQEFSDTEPVVFESQVYNNIFEPVYGNSIRIEITDSQGKKTDYSYVTAPGNTRYRIGGLSEGVYRYRVSTEIDQKREETRGQFLVSQQQAEIQNLTADFELLRKVSSQSGGSFVTAQSIDNLADQLLQAEVKQVIRSEDQFDSIINLRWFFIILLLLISAEWFIRKFLGGY